MKDETPLLGRYDSMDDIVIWKHIDWAGSCGIDSFLIDGQYVIDGNRFFVPKKFLEKDMKIGVFSVQRLNSLEERIRTFQNGLWT